MESSRRLANAIRALSIDAVEQAKSGHPGMPMGMADIAEVLWRDFLSHNPLNPQWPNRDRFVLSNGHGCMLLYAVLHLTGYDISIEDLKKFRQLHSTTPGHPEFGHTPGVEATTGPLGQGLAMATGMAIAEKHLNAEFGEIINHYTYVFAGDGCLMEGVSHEACSLAGTLQLGKLIVFYDDNGISIDGVVSGWFTDNTAERFRAYQWEVIENVDGHNREAIKNAIIAAKNDTMHPTLIICKTKIGYGAPNLGGSEKTHGAPLGETEAALAKKALGWHEPPFVIPEEIYSAWDGKAIGTVREEKWQEKFAEFEKKHPDRAAELTRRCRQKLPKDWKKTVEHMLVKAQAETKSLATRKTSHACINYLTTHLPELLGGSADLTESNNTQAKSTTVFSAKNPTGNYIHYGVREFGMSAIMNGIALHHGFIPFGGTFLTFSDYARNAVRLSALMQQKVIYIYTHDSIGLGEDGPTHQPIEHIAMLRMTPGMRVWRPCDYVETVIAWKQAIEHHGPSALLLTRQSVPPLPHPHADEIAHGGYILFEPNEPPHAIIIATGSETALAFEAAKQLSTMHIFVRVVSMPCCEVFKQQDEKYREKVLPKQITARIAVEAGVRDYWYQFVGNDGKIIGIDTFGASAPEKDIWPAFGFTVEHIINAVKEVAHIPRNELKEGVSHDN